MVNFTLTEEERQKCREDALLRKQLFQVAMVVGVLFLVILAMKLGVELEKSRFIRQCDTKHKITVNDVDYRCSRDD